MPSSSIETNEMPLHQYDIRNVRIVIANFIILLFTYKKQKERKNEQERVLSPVRINQNSRC